MRYALIYGAIAGLIVLLVLIPAVAFGQGTVLHSEWFGYLVMLTALTFVFVGVKRYRDVERGGVIGFGPAFLVGLGIAVVAGIVYVAVWEVYLALTDYAFFDQYVRGVLRAREAEGVSPAALATEAARLEKMRADYANPLFRLPMTFLEIFPVGLIVALLSAATLRNARFMPAAR